MTKEEIVALIATKIEGQGTNIDAGSVLPVILNGIIDLIPASPTPPTPAETMALLSVTSQSTQAELISGSGTGLTKGAACEALGITSADLDKLLEGNAVRFAYSGGSIAVGSIAGNTVNLGDAAAFSITISYNDQEGTYDVTATAA